MSEKCKIVERQAEQTLFHLAQKGLATNSVFCSAVHMVDYERLRLAGAEMRTEYQSFIAFFSDNVVNKTSISHLRTTLPR